VRVPGVIVHERFVEFELATRATDPVNPLTGASVTVEEPGELAMVVTEVGLAFTVKS